MDRELYQYYILDRKHKEKRLPWEENLAERYRREGLSPEERMVRRFEEACDREVPHIHPSEKIVFCRTTKDLPDVLTQEEWEAIRKEHYVHEFGYVSNLSPDYEKTIREGLLARREKASLSQKRMIDALLGLCDRYREEAVRTGRKEVAEVLARVPRYGATNFYEALQFFRILHFALWLEGDYHNTVGRFDCYLFPYFKRDMDAGVYTEESALSLVEDFFLSFNKDSDLYPGQQQGDNGQSMMLGGRLRDGSDGFNKLSELCLSASRNLGLIDPKINLRVNRDTPLSLYEKGTELTRVGLGFPQYSNDDVVIDGLVRLGYDYEDAVNYTVAACWEFIIPGVGDDIANIGAVNFPRLVDEAIRSYLPAGDGFDGLLDEVKRRIFADCEEKTSGFHNVWFLPSPFMDLLRDARKYHNFGLHGCGIASAADALAAVEKYVYREKRIAPDRLIQALDEDYRNDPELLHLLRFEAPKMGTGSEDADRLGCRILDWFADALEGKKNDLGGVWRAGTGTAMYYLWYARDLGSTADGRRAGEPFGTNFSPSLFAEIPGPLTDIESFTKPNFRRAINGGPLTLEFASNVFAGEGALTKVAMLVRHFVKLGGHQLQLNAVNPEKMREAQKYPDRYRQLVVRVWGWSAYFVELDKEFQDHVMARQEYSV